MSRPALRHLIAATVTVALTGGLAATVPASAGATSTGADAAPAAVATSDAAADELRKWPVRFGSTVFERSGESYAQAFQRVKRTYGKPGLVRMFFPGKPQPWSSIRRNVGDTRVLVSFKAPLQEIVNGRHDSFFRNWFANAPRDRVTRWSLWHEPEDDAERGQLNKATYRQAWAHLARLAHRTGNDNLKATLILMCWTTEKNSGRNWRDYYAGAGTIDLLAFDCYNAGHRASTYRSVSGLLGNVVAAARAAGKPWGIAELGSVVVNGDNGTGRARWLKKVAAYARQHDGRFISYFDSDVGTDYRLHDAPSRNAWKSIVTGQW